MESDARIVTRRGTREDLEAIAAVQELAPEASQWNPEDYLRYQLTVAEMGGFVVGFLCSREMAGEVEILNVAVSPDFRRRGIATKLLASLRSHETVFLEVRESNFRARKLYESSGFQTVSRRRKYYSNPDEDGLVMVLSRVGEGVKV
jgi:ribosomal-protein-alanine acetyltransferase